MPRRRPPVIDIGTITRCMDAYVALIEYKDELRKTNDAARFVQYPKVPSPCTQALVRHLIAARLLLADIGQIDDIIVGSREGDLVLVTPTSRVVVEVKATARDYTELSTGDLGADYLLWLDFARFRDAGDVVVHVIAGPIERFGWPADRGLHLPQFVARTGAELQTVTVNLPAWAAQAGTSEST
jgi:hypothetical protein